MNAIINEKHCEYQPLMSSDDSDDDDYNYLTALDNLNWNSNQSPEQHPIANQCRPSLPTARPAVKVKTKSNRNEYLFKDIIASEKDKTKELPKSDHLLESNKRDFEDFEDQVIDIVVDQQISKNNTKRQKVLTNMSESEYSLKEVLNQKKANHEKSVNNNNNNKTEVNRLKNQRLFGKAFSPTIHSPEVPVMRPQVPPLSVSRHSMTLNDDNSLLDSKYNPNAILAIILDWNTKWLSECTPTEVPPPLSPFGEGIGVKTCYESLDEYQSAYIPLILFETWAQIYEEFHRKSKHSDEVRFQAVMASDYSSDEHFITVLFQTVVPKSRLKNHRFASEGDLVLMELSIDVGANNEPKKVILFGYVTDYSTEAITSATTTTVALATSQYSNHLLLKYSVVMSKKPIRINTRQPISVRTVYYLKPTMRQIELIAGLNACPLFKDILRPRLFTCQVVVPNKVSLNTANFNESQSRAILGSSEALNRPYAVPKLLFIQGPPGTGKTHTLIGIIKQIYMKWDSSERMPRILICAPSNGAVDEIARRLYRERKFLLKHKCERPLRCVRIGQISQIHSEVRKISLETLIEENADNEEKRFKEIKQKQTRDLEEKIAKLDQEIADSGTSKELVQQKNNELKKLMVDLQRVSSAPKPSDMSKSRLRIEIMNKADVVLSTLNSCHQSPIENLFRNYGNNTFDCVLVDEASQCSEPELLMPLAYKMTKMILIGDPMQLPATVISKKAGSLHLGRSLFERFFHYYRECEQTDCSQKSPILMLTEQYRMHPQICHFPSQHFYDGRLTSSEKVVQNRDFKLKPYIVFDVTDTLESRTDPTNKHNELEAKFVVRLLALIDKMFDPIVGGSGSGGHKPSIGVITPYNGQKKFLTQRLEDENLKLNVEINTVDGFQGQERDVIILSCVRAFDTQNSGNHSNSIGFLNSVQRMNVALTRAKYSMIICISGRSLQNDKNWKALIDDSMKRSPHSRFKVPSTLAKDKLTKMLLNVDKKETIEVVID